MEEEAPNCEKDYVCCSLTSPCCDPPADWPIRPFSWLLEEHKVVVDINQGSWMQRRCGKTLYVVGAYATDVALHVLLLSFEGAPERADAFYEFSTERWSRRKTESRVDALPAIGTKTTLNLGSKLPRLLVSRYFTFGEMFETEIVILQPSQEEAEPSEAELRFR